MDFCGMNLHRFRGGQYEYPYFPVGLSTSTPHNILSKPLAVSHITIAETINSGEKMNPVAMTITSSRGEYWPSL